MTSRTKYALLTLFLCVCIATTVYAVTLFTLAIPSKMRLKVGHGLELHINDAGAVGDLVTEIDWGEFEDGEIKSGLYWLVNTGDVDEKVVWSAAVPSEWSLVIEDETATWNKGDTRTIAYNDKLYVRTIMQELTAEQGVNYTFDLLFNVVD